MAAGRNDAVKITYKKRQISNQNDVIFFMFPGRDGSCAEDLIDGVISNSAGSAHQLTQLLVALLRAIGFEV